MSPQIPRPSHRKYDEMREIEIIPDFLPQAEGSCLVKCGNTHIICTASVDDRVPSWMRNTGKGWVTAEYGMLPRSTGQRMDREAARGKQSGRTQEIQRLIGRALRAVVDMEKLGERQIKIDCDVIQADGGTRTASITGGFVALARAINYLQSIGALEENPINDSVSAISCGVYKGNGVLDLDYAEDSTAETDANFVFTGSGKIVEIQGTAEEAPFSEEEFLELLRLAKKGCGELKDHQEKAIEG